MNECALSNLLTNTKIPSVTLFDTGGHAVALDKLDGCTVIYTYPRINLPSVAPPPGWNAIRGAKGCIPQSCGFRDRFAELRSAGVTALFGVSVQDSIYQKEVVERLSLPFPMLSDEKLELRNALDLPTFETVGLLLLHRTALILFRGIIQHVFHPVENPAQNAEDVAAWLLRRCG